MVPSHIQTTEVQSYRRSGYPRLVLSLNGEALGELHQLDEDRWGWDDAIMGRDWNWGLNRKAMAGWLKCRCSPDFPRATVSKLWGQWKASYEKSGRSSKETTRISNHIASLFI